jgi:transcription initiation factor IIE alpha subunit
MWRPRRYEVRGTEKTSLAPVKLCFYSEKVALRVAKTLAKSEVYDKEMNETIFISKK